MKRSWHDTLVSASDNILVDDDDDGAAAALFDDHDLEQAPADHHESSSSSWAAAGGHSHPLLFGCMDQHHLVQGSGDGAAADDDDTASVAFCGESSSATAASWSPLPPTVDHLHLMPHATASSGVISNVVGIKRGGKSSSAVPKNKRQQVQATSAAAAAPLDSSSAREPVRKRAKQAKRACAHCRRSHLSCADVRPCPRCARLGIECRDSMTEYQVTGISPTALARAHAAAAAAATASTMLSPPQPQAPQLSALSEKALQAMPTLTAGFPAPVVRAALNLLTDGNVAAVASLIQQQCASFQFAAAPASFPTPMTTTTAITTPVARQQLHSNDTMDGDSCMPSSSPVTDDVSMSAVETNTVTGPSEQQQLPIWAQSLENAEELTSSKERQVALLGWYTAEVPCVSLDEHYAVQTFNRAFARLFELSPASSNADAGLQEDLPGAESNWRLLDLMPPAPADAEKLFRRLAEAPTAASRGASSSFRSRFVTRRTRQLIDCQCIVTTFQRGASIWHVVPIDACTP